MPAIAYELPELPYDYDALEPHIDAETLRIHHDQHHRRYANDLNEVLADYPGLADYSIEALLWNLDRVPEEIYPLARFYGGGCANHQLFWKVMAPALAAADAPTGALADTIDEAFGGLDAFVEAFTDAALSVFGSGWAFLTTDEEGTLWIEATRTMITRLRTVVARSSFSTAGNTLTTSTIGTGGTSTSRRGGTFSTGRPSRIDTTGFRNRSKGSSGNDTN